MPIVDELGGPWDFEQIGFLPEKRLAALTADLFRVHLATATIVAMSRNCAARFESFATAVYARVAAAAVNAPR